MKSLKILMSMTFAINFFLLITYQLFYADQKKIVYQIRPVKFMDDQDQNSDLSNSIMSIQQQSAQQKSAIIEEIFESNQAQDIDINIAIDKQTITGDKTIEKVFDEVINSKSEDEITKIQQITIDSQENQEQVQQEIQNDH